MASPTPSDFVTTDITSAGTSHVINIPTSAVAGDRVAVGFGYGVTGNTITPPAAGVIADETVEQAGGGSQGLYALVYEVQGAETTITIGTSISTKGAAVACLVTGDDDSTPATITTANGSNAVPDPPASTDPGASAADILVIAIGAMGGETAMTAAPTDYSNFTEADSGTAGAVTSNSRVGIGTRQITTADAQDPGVFSGGDVTQEWAAATILFMPSAGAAAATASIDSDLPALTAAVTAEVLLEATIDSDLPALTQAATAEVLLEAAIAGTLPALTQAVEAAVGAVAEAAVAHTLPALIQSVTAESTLEAELAGTLPAMAQAVTAETAIFAAISSVLPALTQSADAESIIEAAVAQALPALIQSATAQAVTDGEAAVDSDLPALTQSVTVASVVEATLAQALPALIQAAEAQAVEPAQAAIDQTLPALTQTVSAALGALDAAVNQNLPALTQRARVVFGGGGKEGFVVWRDTRNPHKTKRRLPFQGGPYR